MDITYLNWKTISFERNSTSDLIKTQENNFEYVLLKIQTFLMKRNLCVSKEIDFAATAACMSNNNL